MKEIIIIGASGHGKVIANIIESNGDRIIGFLDDDPAKKEILNYPVLGKIADVKKYKHYEFIIAIGDNRIRKKIAEEYDDLTYHTAIHKSAVVDSTAKIGKGTVVMANAVINAEATIGKHCIINTGAIIEHDNQIGNYTHISPHATLCGTVQVGDMTHIGAGAVVKNNVSIGSEIIVGAGSTVIENLEKSGIYVGIPAKRVKS